MKDLALQLKNITKSYIDGESENIVLNNINLEVEHGEFVAIVGPSGSGKSTFLSISGALLSATSGQVIIGKNDITKMSKKEL